MLTDLQKDALTEIINIGVGRAGSVLSELVGTIVKLHVPSVGLTSLSKLPECLSLANEAELASVRQNFTGTLDGRAILLFPRESGNTLARQLIGEDSDITSIDSEREEALTEVGNILLNSVLGSMSNILNQRLEYGMPQYNEGALKKLAPNDNIHDTLNDNEDDCHILYANAHFDIEAFRITGNVLIVFDVTSFNQLLTRVDKMSLQTEES